MKIATILAVVIISALVLVSTVMQPWNDTRTTETRSLLDSSHVGAAIEGAVGLHIYLTQRVFVGAEYKVIDLIGKDFSPTAAGQQEGLLSANGTTGMSSIGFMLGFGF